jgi:glycosyltransferase involved in cell wall biosynthesis
MFLNLTVIIPAYNVEKYLEACVNSIILQSVQPQTILIINDGSNDETELIAEKLTKQYSICKLITIDHAGMGIARNIGVKNSNTEFIYFVDSDDLLLPGIFNEFIEETKKSQILDLFCFSGGNFIDEVQDYTLSDSTFLYKNAYVFDNGISAFSTLIHNNNFFCSPVLMIFRKDILNWETNGFLDIIHEDEEWTPRLFLNAGTTIISKNKYYARRIRRGSVTFQNESIKNLLGYYNTKKTLLMYKSSTQQKFLISALDIRISYIYNIIFKIALVNRINLLNKPFNFKLKDYLNFFFKSPILSLKFFLVGMKRIFFKNLKDKF